MNRQRYIITGPAAIIIIIVLTPAFFYLNRGPASAVSGNYNRTETRLDVFADWNVLDDDFLLKEGGAMAGDLDMNGHFITGVNTDTSDPQSSANVDYVNNTAGTSLGGAVYVNWGRTDCGADAMLYSGISFGANYLKTNAGTNDICIERPADLGEQPIPSGATRYWDEIFPSQTCNSPNLPSDIDFQHNIGCAVCFRDNSSCHTFYGTHSCSTAPFTVKAYDGYSLGALSSSHSIGRERRCVNRAFDPSFPMSGQPWQAPNYGSRIEDDLGLGIYDTTPEPKFIKCAVCCN